MNVVLFGVTGRAGSRILAELLSRGHGVKAVIRDSNTLASRPGLSIATDDLSDVVVTTQTIKDQDAIISAYAPPANNTDDLVRVTGMMIEAIRRSNAPRFLMGGGAGGLEVSPGISLIDSGRLPPEWLPISQSHVKAFHLLRSSDINWTYLAPSAYFEPGERTGKFRLGTDNLIVSEGGDSRISMEDYAIAMVNELEQPQHRMQRFAVGY